MAKAKKSKARKSKAKKSKTKKAKKPVKRAVASSRGKAKKSKARKATKTKAAKPKARAAKKAAPKKKQAMVGERDYQASRSFLKDQTEFVKRHSSEIPGMAKDAEAALEGPQGDQLRAAEDEARGHAAGE